MFMRAGVAPGLVGAALLALCAGAPVSRAEQLAVRTYTTTDGLAGDSITALLEDSRGYLWIGTLTGLARFDGTSFVVYTTSDGLPAPGISAVLEDRAGSIWVGTGAGLACLLAARRPDGTLFETVTFAAHMPPGFPAAPANEVGGIALDPAGALWVSAGPGLYRVEPGAHRRVAPVELPFSWPPDRPQVLGGLAEDPAGAIWAVNPYTSVRRRPDGAVETVPLRGMEPLFDRAGDLWMLGYGGVARYTPEVGSMREDNREPVPIAVAAGEAAPPPAPGRLVVWGQAAGLSGKLFSLARASDGAILVTTDHGLCAIRNQRVRCYGTAEGLSEERVRAVLEDSNGNLWAGTASRGVMRIAQRGLIGFTRRDGLLTDKLSQVLPDGRGGVLLAAFPPALGVHRPAGGRMAAARYALPAGLDDLGWSEGQGTVLDHRGGLWVAAGWAVLRYPAVARFEELENAAPVAVYRRKELGSDQVFRLFEDSRGDVWMGLFDPNHVARWERATGTVRHYTASDGAFEGTASAFAQDRDGAVWAGFYTGGIARWRDGRFDRFGEAEGVPGGFVSSMLGDSHGRLWVGLLRHGLLRIDEPGAERPRIVGYGRREGLGSEAVSCLAEGDHGQIWVGTRAGIDRLDPATGAVRHYDAASGLINNAVVSLRTDSGGRLWIATADGVSCLTEQREGATAPLRLRLTELRAGGRAVPLPELGATELAGVRLPVGVRDVQLSFAGISLTAGETVRYQHRLGAGEWSAPISERRLHLAGLAPGGYRLELRAVRSDGAESAVTSVGLVLPPPLWRRPWAIGLEVLLPAVAVALVWRARRRRLAELERVRARIASDLHDELGLSLSRIAVLSEVARRKAAGDGDAGGAEMAEIGEEARDLIDATSDMAWALDPAADDLPSLLARLRRMIADVFDGGGVSWTFAAPEATVAVALGAEQRRHLYLILKEAVHNAARHARPRRVEVTVAVAAGKLRAEVRDDGVGFVLDNEARPPGHGLIGMARRAEELGGRLEVESHPGGGTVVRLTAPLGRTA